MSWQEALEDELRTNKRLASNRIKEQDHNYRQKMVEGVCKARKVEAAAQRTADVKKHRLVTSREDFERFKAMLV